jgi:type I restriction enzyme M protein
MAKEKKPKEISLEAVLWNCCNVLRTREKSDNRKAVLGLAFLKFVGDKFVKQQEKIRKEFGDNNVFLSTPSFYLSDNVFYLSETSRWGYIVANKSKNDIATILDTAMKNIEDNNPSLKGALELNLYAPLNLEIKQLSSLIDEINKITEDRFHEKDLIGQVYEYFLSIFSIYEGKAGEYYTPKTIVDLIAELIEPFSGRIYDPCCGSGGMFIQSYKFVDNHKGDKANISVFGQEENPTTYKLAKMNLAIRGISNNLGQKAYSTFLEDQHKDEKMDFIMANPPFNLKNWYSDSLSMDPRWRIGGESIIPPASNANYAWILHMLSKLDVNHGIAGFLLANGALGAGSKGSRINNGDSEAEESETVDSTNAEYRIRRQLIEQDKIEAIFILPREMFYSTDISVTLWILNNNKKEQKKKCVEYKLNTDGSMVLDKDGRPEVNVFERHLRNRENEMLFIDLRTWNTNLFDKKFVEFDPVQIQRIKKIYHDWQGYDIYKYHNVPELCKSVKKEEIVLKDYSLVPSKYIEFIDHDLNIDYPKEMARIQNEMKKLIQEEKDTQKLLKDAFKGIGYEIE